MAVALLAPSSLRAQETDNNKLLKTDLLVVTAHPDDESMMAAVMAKYADKGKVVSLVTCTRGEGGGNGTGKELGASLGTVREAELRRCVGILGTRYLYFLNQPDWAYTESVQATLAKWGKEESLRRLVRLVRILRPEVICTMDPAPMGGQHGHHQAAGRLATEAFEAAADPTAFPEQLEDEGITVWRVRKLYWVSFGGKGTVQIRADEIASGSLAAANPGKNYGQIAGLAEMNHRSQGFDKFLGTMINSAQNVFSRPTGFLLVKSRLNQDPAQEKDLFDGIAGADFDSTEAAHDRLAERYPLPPTMDVEARVQPLQPVQEYQAWLQNNNIARLMRRLPAHVPVTLGMASPVTLTLTNHTNAPRSAKVSLSLPAGWKSDNEEKSVRLEPNKTTNVVFRVTPPADAKQGSHKVAAILNGKETDAGEMDALPQLTIKRLTASLPTNADIAKWEGAGFQSAPIPHTNGAQGMGSSPNEISGRFFVGYDAEALHVLVDVTDDTVVFNIAPDDIKGHWRTTSTEICIDPTPRSENTFSTLKLGIFPQDITGRVRAGRDADANPGPVDKKEPSIQLASKRTPKGYIVEARIPWNTLRSRDFRPTSGRTLGFNVILYHAGKKEARTGEDIGKSRLAWSYWSGVWGRPVVWGTATLK